MEDENKPTKAFIITKYLIQNYGFIVAQIVTLFIHTMPDSPNYVSEEENKAYFKPNHKKIIKLTGAKESLYWYAVNRAIEAGILSKIEHKKETWYSIDFVRIEAEVNAYELEVGNTFLEQEYQDAQKGMDDLEKSIPDQEISMDKI